MVVWRVVDTAEALFEVDNYEHYVHVQTEAALRNLATSYPYDAHDERHMSLRGHTAEVAEQLKREIQERLAKAGVEVLEARISHLAYAPEIAAAMLQRQQAGAIIAARQRIVEGAVGMVEMALDMLSQQGHRARSTRSARRRWSATCWSCCAASATRSRSSTPGRSTSKRRTGRGRAQSHSCCASIRPCWTRVQRWADDDLRSLNGQIEFLLRRALQDSGRGGAGRAKPAKAKP